ncbi:DUF3667 domain-containing protein [bacterium]|nr:DUF3667 domain-containing protein [bacterium]
MKKNKTSHCLNCGQYISDFNFCPHCGQMNTDKRITVRQMIRDFLGDYFTFDSKFFRSLFPLLIRPGHLTREYVSGRRNTYVLPLRLYLFTSFLFFFILTLNTKLDQKKINFAESEKATVSSDSLKSILNEYRSTLPEDLQDEIIRKIKSKNITVTESDSTEKGINLVYNESDSGRNPVSRYLNQKGKYIKGMGRQGGILFVKALINQIPKVLFVMLPFFALVLKLLYVRHKILYLEHFVFSLHMHTFMFLSLILTLFFPKWFIILPVLTGILIYLLVSIRTFYGQSWKKSFLKMNLLLFLYGFGLLPALLLLILLALISV